MSAQTVTKLINQILTFSGLFTKDANGNPCQGITYTLNVLSGPSGGLGPITLSGGTYQVQCLKVGVYTVTLTATNTSGSLTTDAAGDSDGTFDTINVVEPAPATQGWTYQ